MSLLDIDGFDFYTASQSTSRGWNAAFGSMQTGRFGTGQCARQSSATAATRNRVLSAAVGTLTLGAAVRISLVTTNTVILSFRDSTNVQIDLRTSADGTGKLSVTRNGTVLGTTAATHVEANTWFHIVLTVTFSNTGAYELWVNSTSVLSGTSVDTTATANNTADRYYLHQNGNGVITDFDDLWWRDDAINSGDIRIEALVPNGNGNSSQFTGSDGNSTDNYLLVDEVTHNSDTDYVSSSTVGHIDTYAMSDLPTTATSVLAVAERITARKDDAGARSGRTVLRVSATDYEGSDIALGDTYAVHSTLRTTNPNTGVAWTGAGVNGIEAGAKVQT